MESGSQNSWHQLSQEQYTKQGSSDTAFSAFSRNLRNKDASQGFYIHPFMLFLKHLKRTVYKMHNSENTAHASPS